MVLRLFERAPRLLDAPLPLGSRVRAMVGDGRSQVGLGGAHHDAACVDEPQCTLQQLLVLLSHAGVLFPDLLALDDTHEANLLVLTTYRCGQGRFALTHWSDAAFQRFSCSCRLPERLAGRVAAKPGRVTRVMPGLVLGPLLRYTGSTQATVWVETDAACEVAVLGAHQRTFCVEGHHYALVVLSDLDEGTVRPYEIHLDGERAWPPDDGRPPSTIHTREHERRARLVFGSCRVGDPERPPFTLERSQHPLGFGIDALWALSRRLQSGQEEWPDCLLLLGDQVYADETSEQTRAFIRARRDTSRPPGEQVADFEEYARLYREAWSDPDIRWLLSTVPSTMIFDDHDVHDDWNISAAWVREMRATAWWDERISGAFMSYWIYQHIGNLAPPELEEERLLAEISAVADGGPRLREFARAIDREPAASRFAFHRDFGRSRLVVIDSRAARVLTEGSRDMVDDEEWQWIAEHTRGAFDHLIIASTLPVFMTPGDRWAGGLERGGLLGRLGTPGRARRREDAPRRRSRALARVPAVVQDDGRAVARARRRPGFAGHDLVHRR